MGPGQSPSQPPQAPGNVRGGRNGLRRRLGADLSGSGSLNFRAAVHHGWDVERQTAFDRAHAERGESIRIISARKAAQSERKQYEEKS